MFEVYKLKGTDFEGNVVLEPESTSDAYDRLQADLSVADEFQGYGGEPDAERDGDHRKAPPHVLHVCSVLPSPWAALWQSREQ